MARRRQGRGRAGGLACLLRGATGHPSGDLNAIVCCPTTAKHVIPELIKYELLKGVLASTGPILICKGLQRLEIPYYTLITLQTHAVLSLENQEHTFCSKDSRARPSTHSLPLSDPSSSDPLCPSPDLQPLFSAPWQQRPVLSACPAPRCQNRKARVLQDSRGAIVADPRLPAWANLSSAWAQSLLPTWQDQGTGNE